MATPKRSRLRWLSLLLCALFTLPLAPAQSNEPYRITVMSRNIYLGADVGVALDLIGQVQGEE